MDTAGPRTTGGLIEWDLYGVPPLALDQVELRRRLRVAGLGGLIVTSHDVVVDAEAGDPEPSHRDGRLVRISTAAPYEKVLPRSTSNIPLANYAWPVLTVSLNRTQAAERVQAAVRAGVAPERAWADLVDGAIQGGIWRGAARTLLNAGGDLTPRLASLMLFAASVFLVASGYVLGGLVFYAGALLFELGLNSIINLVMYGGIRLGRRRWSLLPGVMHLDRLAVAGLQRGTGRLVKVPGFSAPVPGVPAQDG